MVERYLIIKPPLTESESEVESTTTSSTTARACEGTQQQRLRLQHESACGLPSQSRAAGAVVVDEVVELLLQYYDFAYDCASSTGLRGQQTTTSSPAAPCGHRQFYEFVSNNLVDRDLFYNYANQQHLRARTERGVAGASDACTT
jgi:hypothetical protein